MTARTRLRGLALIVISVITITACSSNGNDAAPATSSQQQGSDAQGDPGGTIRIGYDLAQTGGIPIKFDPIRAEGNDTANDGIFYLIYGRFLRPTEEGGLEPDLATSVTIASPTEIDIELRPGLTFSDGSPFDAVAVKASLDAQLANEADNVDGLLSSFFDLESVEAPAPTTVKLSIPNGTAASWFDTNIGGWQTSIVKVGSDPNKPIGAGPFTVADYQAGQSVTLAKNPSYWDAASIKPGGYEFTHIAVSQAQSAYAALQAGQIDVATNIDPAQISTLSSPYELYARTSPKASTNLHICKTDGPLADARVRRAISKAIDRDAINEAVYAGTAEPALQSWPTDHRLNSPEVDDEAAYDPEGARELLAEAGYADGVDLDLYVVHLSDLDQAAVVLQQQMEEVGINLSISASTDYFNDYMAARKPALGLYPANANGPLKLAAWSGGSVANICGYDDPELNTLVDQLAKVSSSSDEAIDLWDSVNQTVADDGLSAFIAFRSVLAAYNDQQLGDMSSWGEGQYTVPDPRITFVKAKS